MALPRRMQLAIRSGARAGRRSKFCENVYSETTRASYDRVFWTEYTAESTTAHPPHSLVSGWAFAGPRLTSLPWPCSLQTQPARPTFTGSSNTQLYSQARVVPAGYRRCSRDGGWWWQLGRTSEAVPVLSSLREVKVNGDTLPSKPQHALWLCN